MRRFAAFLRSTAGTKAVSAASGAFVGGWVLLHLAGNLTLLGAPGAADAYAVRLHALGPALWAIRIALAVALAVHVWATVTLRQRARRAKPAAHTARRLRGATLASRTMRVGGAVLAIFVVLHVPHLTFGAGVPGFVPLHVHDNVVRALASPIVAGGYLVAAAVLGLHVLHGYWSVPRSLGLRIGSARQLRRPLVTVVAVAVATGFASVPLLVVTGVLR